MALDFTTIKDEPGSAIFFIYDGTDMDRQTMERLRDDVASRARKQSILLSSEDDNAKKLIDFYDLRGSRFVLIIRDNDQLHHVWSDGELFDPSQIAYTAERAG